MSDFLKNLKRAVDNGEVDETIVNHHNEILHRIDMDEKRKRDEKQESILYNSVINEYSLPNDFNEVVSARNEAESYKQEVASFIYQETKDELKAKAEAAKLGMDNFVELEKKKLAVIVNLETIKSLTVDNLSLYEKLNKNLEMIRHCEEQNTNLNEEIEKLK